MSEITDDVAAKMLEELETPTQETKDALTVHPTENIEKTCEASQQTMDNLIPVNRKQVEGLLNNLIGVNFKFGDMFFRIKYINVGKGRFSAELVNEIK